MSDIFELFKKINKAPGTPSQPVSFIIAGLGNPGDKYTFTRHNAGFLTVDYISQKLGFKVDRLRFKALCGETVIAGRRGLVIKPQTYMNASGESVREAADFYKITPENVIVICDDVNLEPGKLRVRKKGSDGGQKGLRSITEHLGTEEFPRIRLGVGAKPHPDYDIADWVLSEFTEDAKKLLFTAMERTCDGLPLVVSGDFERAMNLLN